MKTRTRASLVSLMMCLVAFSGCLQLDDEKDVVSEEIVSPNGIFVTGPDGVAIDVPFMPMSFVFSDVGEDGPEPSIGITSSLSLIHI